MLHAPKSAASMGAQLYSAWFLRLLYHKNIGSNPQCERLTEPRALQDLLLRLREISEACVAMLLALAHIPSNKPSQPAGAAAAERW